MLTGDRRRLSYNFANKVVSIDRAAGQNGLNTRVTFAYGADGSRVAQTVVAGGSTTRTVYVGLGNTGKSMCERTKRGSVVEHAHFIYAGTYHGGSAFAIRVIKTEGANEPVKATQYYHFDHLGSVTAMSDDGGEVADSAWAGADAGTMGYDSWGARRNPDGSFVHGSAVNLQPGHREFTGHESIPNVGLINMNGRVYDPVLGRFLSPDPHVQFVADLQSYNRYSYVLNNPLRYTDPTGYHLFGSGTGDKIAGISIVLVGAVVCTYSGGAGIACSSPTLALLFG